MNFIERLVPHLIFVAALVPTFLLLAAAAAVSLSEPTPAIDLPLPVQAALSCDACRAAEAE
jgi:hypothetical protein